MASAWEDETERIAMEMFGKKMDELDDRQKMEVLDKRFPEKSTKHKATTIDWKRKKEKSVYDKLAEAGNKMTMKAADISQFKMDDAYKEKLVTEILDMQHPAEVYTEEELMKLSVEELEKIEKEFSASKEKAVEENAGKYDWIPFERKPSSWVDVNKEIPASSIPDYDKLKVYNWDDYTPYDDFPETVPQYFILAIGGKKFLINTEGYNYARYVVEVV